MRVSFKSLGCKINQFDSGVLKERFAASGAEIVPDGDAADVYVINTCTVTRKSDYQCRQAIRRAVRQKQEGAKVIVTGCYARTNPEEIRRITGVDLVVGSISDLCVSNPTLRGMQGQDPQGAVLTAQSITGRSRAFLKVQEGCDAYCSYCIVPFARGRSRSARFDDVVRSVDGLIGQGFHEVVLTGVHLGAYGLDMEGGPRLSMLVEKLLDRPGLGRLRLSSIEPMEFDEGVVGLAAHEKLCRHFHVPLQSGDDKVLASMGRNYSADGYFRLIDRLAQKAPGACLGADVIVGYPAEDDERFEETYRRIEDSPLNHLHVFTYSPRPGTKAYGLGDPVHGDVKRERSRRLRELSRRKNLTLKESLTGLTMSVVVEDGGGDASGLTDNYVRVAFGGYGLARRSAVDVRIEGVDGDVCRGVVV